MKFLCTKFRVYNIEGTENPFFIFILSELVHFFKLMFIHFISISNRPFNYNVKNVFMRRFSAYTMACSRCSIKTLIERDIGSTIFKAEPVKNSQIFQEILFLNGHVIIGTPVLKTKIIFHRESPVGAFFYNRSIPPHHCIREDHYIYDIVHRLSRWSLGDIWYKLQKDRW